MAHLPTNNPALQVAHRKVAPLLHHEIERRQKIEKKLRLNEYKFRQLAEHLQDVVWLETTEGETLYINSAFKRIWGESVRNAYSSRRYWLHHVVEEDLPNVRAHIRQARKTGFEFKVRYRIVRSDGETRWISTKAMPIKDFTGQVYRFVFISEDITRRKNAEDRLKESTEQLRALSKRLTTLQEEERIRIAREVHDELGQMLTVLKMDLNWIQENAGEKTKGLRDKIKIMDEHIGATISTVRRISSELRPMILDELGLPSAIQSHLAEFERRTGIQCESDIHTTAAELDSQKSISVFRVLQEALTNVARHARASHVKVVFKKTGNPPNEFKLEIEDNGVGIHLNEQELRSQHSLGLIGIRERAVALHGKIEIGRHKNKGTRVRMTFPIGAEKKCFGQAAEEALKKHLLEWEDLSQ